MVALAATLLVAAGVIEMAHEPVRQASPGQELELNARIQAELGVYLPMLMWRPVGGKDYRRVPMQNVGGDRFRARIPAAELKADLEYFLLAYDQNLGGPARSGSAANPHRVRVVIGPTVRISAQTPEAAVDLDGATVGTVPWAGPLRPGRHALRVHKSGHRAFELEFVLPPGQDLALDVPKLDPEGQEVAPPAVEVPVTIESVPRGAALKLDGVEVGVEPLLRSVLPGPHQVEALLARHAPASERFEVPPVRAYRLTLRLDPLPATLRVSTEPAGAAISMDGETVGSAPFEALVSPGAHALQARLTDHHPAEITFTAGPGDLLERRLQLEPVSAPWWAWGAAAGALVTGAGALAAMLAGDAAYGDYHERFDAQGVRDRSLVDRANTWAFVSAGLGTLAAVWAALAGYGFYAPQEAAGQP